MEGLRLVNGDHDLEHYRTLERRDKAIARNGSMVTLSELYNLAVEC